MASVEYLEEIWRLAKEQLPGWAYASLRAQAQPKAGGRVAHRKEIPNMLERFALEQLTPQGLKNLNDEDLRETWGSLSRWHKSAKKQKRPVDGFLLTGQSVLQEMTKRKLEVKESPFVQALATGLTQVAKEVQACIAPRHLWGPEKAVVAFIDSRPGQLEDSPFGDRYLKSLGLGIEDVLVGHICPEETESELSKAEIVYWTPRLLKELNELQPQIVVALGKIAKSTLQDKLAIFLPHPKAIEKHGDSGEIARKLKQLKKTITEKSLDTVTEAGAELELSAREGQIKLIHKPHLGTSDKGKNLADFISENESSGDVTKGEDFVPIQKADKLKHIVYAAVVDPYGPNGAQPDAHRDWIPPAAVEETAHKFLQGPMVIGMQHQDTAKAKVVESWVENYPSDVDYQKALAGEDHSVYRRTFGDDVVHSGSWMLGVKLGDEEWKAFEKGEINAFSPGGFGIRSPLSPSEMPKINFIDLAPKGEATP